MKRLFLLAVILGASASAQSPASSTATMPQRSLATPTGRPAGGSGDPDLIPSAGGIVDRATYLRLRSQYIQRLRGLYSPEDVARRSRAIQTMREQERERDRAMFRPESTLSVSSSPNWVSIGPAPIPNGQTEPMEVPVSGRVTAIAVHPTNPNIVYIGAAQGGVFRSLDGGATWTPIMDDAESLAIGSITIDPNNPARLWVGTGEPNFSCDSFGGVGVYRIEFADTNPVLFGPFNQTPLGNRLLGSGLARIAVAAGDSNTIFVAASGDTFDPVKGIGCEPAFGANGLFRSTNALSGTPIFQEIVVPPAGGSSTPSDLFLDPADPNNLVVAVVGDIWRTTNALAASPAFTRVLARSLFNNHITLAGNKIGNTLNLVAVTSEADTGGQCSLRGSLRRSFDGGVTWSGILPGARGFCDSQCLYDMPVALNPVDVNKVIVGGSFDDTTTPPSCGSSILLNTGDGTNFQRAHNIHADAHAIAYAPSNPAVIYFGSDGGIFKSADGGQSWMSLNNSTFNAVQFQSLALHPKDHNFMIGGTQDNGTNFLREDNTWFRTDFGDGGFALVDQNATDTINVTMYHTYANFGGILAGFARVTTTTCASEGQWVFRGMGNVDPTVGCEGTALGKNNGISPNHVLFYPPMALGPGNPNTLYFGADQLYRSSDNGEHMVAVSQNLTNNVISAIGISPNDDNIRIVGTLFGQVYVTTTGSSTLVRITPPRTGYISRAVIDPNDSNIAYITSASLHDLSGERVWKTTNLLGGSPTWQAAGVGIPDVPVDAFAIDPANSNFLYAGTDIGVYKSTDGGAHWAPFGTGLPRVAVFDLAIQDPNRILRAATHGRGIWEIGIGTHFQVSAPGSATAGSPVSITITALDAGNNIATGYTGTVHFTSSDGQAVLPANSTLTNGAGTFPVTLKTTGPQTVTAIDTVTASIRGTSGTITVSDAGADHYSLTYPLNAVVNAPFTIGVAVQDAFNNTVKGYTGTVHFMGSGAPATLPADYPYTGTGVGNDNGQHTFANQFIATGGVGTTLNITVTDTVTNAVTTTTNPPINVISDAPLTAQGRTIRIFRANAPVVVASFTDADTDETGSNLTATINWGDGSTPGSGCTLSSTPCKIVRVGTSNVFNVISIHTYKKKGPFTVTVGMTDSGGSTATANSVARFFPRNFSY